MNPPPTTKQLQGSVRTLQERNQRQAALLEQILTTTLIDPAERFIDPETGERWLPVDGEDAEGRATTIEDEGSLERIRNECRQLAQENEFAINGHENRISYIAGTGHEYTVAAKPDMEVADDRIAECQAVIDEFVKLNKWRARQQEIVRRRDRDGECFLRFFQGSNGQGNGDGLLRVRFVEPAQIKAPSDKNAEPAYSFGIHTLPEDVETVLGYFIDGQEIDVAEIQHRKANVDLNVKRGLPLFYPVRRRLDQAVNLLRNMGTVCGIQAAITFIRKHSGGTQAGLEKMLEDQADVTQTNTSTGHTTHFRRYGAGTILDVPGNAEYEYPSGKINPSTFVPPLQALLRSVASRLTMPEFMLTSDASNANYASTMVAEGPVVKMFQREQATMIEADLEVMDRVFDAAVEAGRISQEVRDSILVDVEPPSLESRNRKEQAEETTMLVEKKIMSKHTGRLRHELDPDFEAEKIEEETEASMANNPFAGMGFGGGNGQGNGENEGQEDD